MGRQAGETTVDVAVGASAPQHAADALPARSFLVSIYRRFAGEALSGEEIVAFEADDTDRNLRRVRVLAPLMVVLHVAHIFMYRLSDSARATLPAEVVRWQDALIVVHAATV